jgi:hypothetical protein
MRHPLLFALALLFLSITSITHAQQPQCLQRSISVHISSGEGTPPLDITPAQISATYQDKPVRITGVSPEQRPQRLVVLLDASGSIRGGTTAGWQATVEAASQLLAAMPPIEIAIGVFAEQVETVIGPTTMHERLMEEIDNLRSGPQEEGPRRQRTALWDSLLDSMDMFGPLRPGDVIYVITDGVDNFSESRPAMVTQVMISAGVRLFAFAIANQGFAYGSGELERMVQDTGGVVAAASASDWRAFQADQRSSPIGIAMHEQHRQILGFRRIDLEFDEAVSRPQPWRLALTGLDENQMRNIVLNYPARLFPCTERAALPVANSNQSN